MPHFDTKKSTTNDVVRHMVIPNSRDGRMGRSFAEKFGPKASATPRCGQIRFMHSPLKGNQKEKEVV